MDIDRNRVTGAARFARPRCWALLGLALLVVLAACGAQSRPSPIPIPAAVPSSPATPTPAIAFPQLAPVTSPRALRAARLEGRLVLVDGCLRVRTTWGPSLLIIWPPEVTLRTAGDAVQVVDATGQVVARVGTPLVLGGGETSSLERLSLRETGPSRCLGPYWLTGDIVVSPTPRPAAVRPPGVAFPQLAPVGNERASRASRLEGTLTLVAGCLRVPGPDAVTSYLIVWPADVALHSQDRRVQVVFPGGRVVTQVGDPVTLLGEAAPTLEQFGDESDKPLRETPPAHCPGPYWISGRVVAPTPTAIPPDWPTPMAPP